MRNDCSTLPDDPVSIVQAARLLDVTVSTIHRWIRSGRITAWKVGGRWRLSRAEVLAVPERHEPVGKSRQSRPLTQAETIQRLRAAGYCD